MAPGRILITGANGFVGRHLGPALASMLPDAQSLHPDFDITDEAAVREAVRSTQPDACVHLAAIAAPTAAQSDPDAAWRVNLHGTLTLARVLAEVSPGATLVYASSADAYGRSFASHGPRLNETAPLNPINTYGATKAAADLALGAMQAVSLRIIRVRPFNHTGRGQSPAFVVPSFARQVARVEAGLQTTVRVGALDTMRDFLDVRDVCRAYALCLLRADELSSGDVFNIASGQARTVGSVLTDLIRLTESRIEVETDTDRLRPSEIGAASGDCAAARQLLGWTPTIPWTESLAEVLDEWRKSVGSPDTSKAE